jgi:hypothetical protein
MLLNIEIHNYTEIPEFDYFSMTFSVNRVNLLYIENEVKDQKYDIIYEHIEDQEASGGSRLVAQPNGER